jgi:hypothetical protein
MAAVRQIAMRRFEIGQVDEISLAPGQPLHRNQVRKGADRSLGPIDASSF